jgi:phosphoribosyl 1,2-cyclic phosphodiesterase
MKVTILGCGPSTGMPAIGPNWGDCISIDPRNRRRRASLLVEVYTVAILIDMSPDLREQLIDARVRRLDAVVLTHARADHLHGIDDMRQLNRLMSAAIPLWANDPTLAEVRRRFGYALRPVGGARPASNCKLPPGVESGQDGLAIELADPQKRSVHRCGIFHNIYYATSACRRNIEMTPLCKVAVTLHRVLGSPRVRRGGGVDEQAGVQPP